MERTNGGEAGGGLFVSEKEHEGQVVDVGIGRSAEQEVAETVEERIAVVVGQRVERIEA
jgi:hypothetical protein